MQFRDFLDIIFKRWKILLASVVLVLGATIWYTLQIPPVYQASARVFLAVTEPGYAITRQDMNTYTELLSSPVVRDPLREELGLPEGSPIDVTGSLSDETNMLTITARSDDPQLAADIANAAGPELAAVGGKFSPLLASMDQDVESVTIAAAGVPGAPISPNMTNNVLLGLMGGLALGLGLVLLRHFLDTKVRGEVDVRVLSPRPILGSLRRIREPERNPVVVESQPHSIAAEEFRRLRTNLQFVDITTGGRHSFAITSAMPGEGKTLTAVNLARAMADSGARVLLVDGDLRHPSVANTMGLEGSVGLTTILLGRAALDDVAQQWGETSLYVLPAGEIPPNPSELLGSTAMEVLFDEFTRLYDFVLVDSPPVIPVVDPVVIEKLVGGLLMVVCVNKTRKRDLAHALRSLKTVDVEVAGFALNMVPGGEGYGKYGPYYAYGEKKGSKKAAAAPVVAPAAPAPLPAGPSSSAAHQRRNGPLRRRRSGPAPAAGPAWVEEAAASDIPPTTAAGELPARQPAGQRLFPPVRDS